MDHSAALKKKRVEYQQKIYPSEQKGKEKKKMYSIEHKGQ